MANAKSENLSLLLWRMVYQTYTRFKNSLDQIFREHGLTMEQYLVLITVKYDDQPVRIIDVARWLERSTNSVSMIADRMVKAGLLRRVRERRDRRFVNISLTSKAENALRSANIPAWDFMQQAMSPLSYEDKNAFASLFKMINYELLEYLNPGADVDRMLKNDIKRQAYLMKLRRKQRRIRLSEARYQRGEKEKSI
jgi:DNA-binding MarR family transcriptional regulator